MGTRRASLATAMGTAEVIGFLIFLGVAAWAGANQGMDARKLAETIGFLIFVFLTAWLVR